MGDPEESVPRPSDPVRAAVEPPNAVAPQVHHELKPSEPILARIRRHKVVEWTLAYVAFGYALLHGVQMLREAFEWPYLVSRLTVLGLVFGSTYRGDARLVSRTSCKASDQRPGVVDPGPRFLKR